MTSERKIESNRANARKSTGPKTAEGQARSAANARRHGLTAAPDVDTVLAWYRVILDNPHAVPDPLELDPWRRAARELAEAEAQLQRVRRAEEQYLRNSEGNLSEWEEELIESRDWIRNWLEDAVSERAFRDSLSNGSLKRSLPTPREYRSFMKQGERLLWRSRTHQERAVRKRLQAQERLGRTLARYRASAEARRRKALRRFIDEIAKRTQTGRG